MLRPRHVAATELIIAASERAACTTGRISRSRKPASSMTRGEAQRTEDQPHRQQHADHPPPENSESIVALPLVDSKPVAIAR
jgi:hypothetical protein